MSLCLGGEPSRLPTLADRRNDLGNLPNLWIKKSLGDLGNRQSALTTDHPMTRIRRESLHKEAAEAGGGRPTTIIGHGSRLSDQKHTRTIQHCSLSVAITIRDHQQAHPSLICSLLRLEAEIPMPQEPANRGSTITCSTAAAAALPQLRYLLVNPSFRSLSRYPPLLIVIGMSLCQSLSR